MRGRWIDARAHTQKDQDHGGAVCVEGEALTGGATPVPLSANPLFLLQSRWSVAGLCNVGASASLAETHDSSALWHFARQPCPGEEYTLHRRTGWTNCKTTALLTDRQTDRRYIRRHQTKGKRPRRSNLLSLVNECCCCCCCLRCCCGCLLQPWFTPPRRAGFCPVQNGGWEVDREWAVGFSILFDLVGRRSGPSSQGLQTWWSRAAAPGCG